MFNLTINLYFYVLLFFSIIKAQTTLDINQNCVDLNHDDGPINEWTCNYGDFDNITSSKILYTTDGGYLLSGTEGVGESSDIFLLKLDPNGQIEWYKVYGGDDRDAANSVIISNDGYIIIGSTRSYSNNDDLWIIKTDFDGNTCDYHNGGTCSNLEQWVQTYDYDQNSNNQIGRDGVWSEINNEYAVLTQMYNPQNESYDIGLYILDTDGNEVHSTVYGEANKAIGNDIGYSIMEDTEDDINNGYIITGYTTSYGNKNPGDLWVIKVDKDGQSCLGNLGLFTAYNEECDTLDFYDNNSDDIFNSTDTYKFNVKDNCNGNCYNSNNGTWAKTFGGVGTDYGLSVDYGKNSKSLIITGFTNSFLNEYDMWLLNIDVTAEQFTDTNGNGEWDAAEQFNDENGNGVFDGIQSTLDGLCNYNYVEEFIDYNNNNQYDESDMMNDSNGNEIYDSDYGFCKESEYNWIQTYGDNLNDGGRSVSSTLDGGYIVVGESFNENKNAFDSWILKTDSLGNELWDIKIGGNDDDFFNSILVSGDGNGYVAAGASITYSQDENYDILVTKLGTDDCSWIGGNHKIDECGVCCNCDFNDPNCLYGCSYYISAEDYGGAYDCNGSCFGNAVLDNDQSYAQGEEFVDTNGNGTWDVGETFTDCNYDFTICSGDDDWSDDMGNGEWNENFAAHCCAPNLRDDCGECFGDNVGCADIIINEIMKNPLHVNDSEGEWFELYNNENSDRSLRNWKLTDGSGDEIIIEEDLIIPSKGYVVLGNNSEFSTNGGIKIDYEYSYSDFTLFNGADKISLMSRKSDLNYVLRDEVSWDNNSFTDEGYSYALINAEGFVPYCLDTTPVCFNNDEYVSDINDYSTCLDSGYTWHPAQNEIQCGNICSQNNCLNNWIILSTYNDDLQNNWAKSQRLNGNGIWDDAEEFIDENNNGKWDDAEEFIDCGFDELDNRICEGSSGWDIIYGNERWDAAEKFTDENNNEKWDDAEEFIDQNCNSKYDSAEEFIDENNNGIWDDTEELTDLNGNGIWDDAEEFIDENNNGIWDDAEELIDINGNRLWDDAEELTDLNGNGLWDNAEEFTDLNGNNRWDEAEIFFDCQINNVNFCENDENWISGLGNGIYDHGEPFADEILYPGDFNSNKMPNFDPEVLVESEEINFYQVMLGDTKDIDFYISNSGSGNLIIKNIIIDSSSDISFTPISENCIINNSGVYEIPQGCDELLKIKLTFSPTDIESYSAILSFETNDYDNPIKEIEITGEGFEPQPIISVNDYMVFECESSVCYQDLTIYNDGEQILYIEEMELVNNSTFNLDQSTFAGYESINPSDSTTIRINFNNPNNSCELNDLNDTLKIFSNYQPEQFEDLNDNNQWDFNEPYIDINENLQWDSGIITSVVLKYDFKSSTLVQLIHNSASPTNSVSSEVDVYIDGFLYVEGFQYRSATPVLDLDTEFTIGIAPAGGDTIAYFQFDLEQEEQYVVVATGILDNDVTPFNLVADSTMFGATDGNVGLNIYHGSTDVPSVDVSLAYSGDLVSEVSDLMYGEFSGFEEFAAAIYTIGIDTAGGASIEGFTADLSGLGGKSAVVFTSGFLTPGDSDPGFGLFKALEDGSVSDLTRYLGQMLYDINGDTNTNVLDIISLIDIILGFSESRNGDLNYDGNIDVIDITILIDYILTI